MRVDEHSLTDQVSSTAGRAAESQRIQVDTATTSGAGSAAAGDRGGSFRPGRTDYRKPCRPCRANRRNGSASCRNRSGRAPTNPTPDRSPAPWCRHDSMRRNELEEMLMGAQQRVRAACTLLMRPLACDADACLALFRDAQGDLERLRERLAEGGVRGRGLARACRQPGQRHPPRRRASRTSRRFRPALAGTSAGGFPGIHRFRQTGRRAHFRGRVSFLG